MQQLPQVLRDDPKISAALEVQQRALKALDTAEREFTVAKAEAVRLSSVPKPFDEEGATRRQAHAKAHDAVHGAKTTAATAKEIDAERAACAKACQDAAAAAEAARVKAEQAEIARRGVESVWHDSNSVLFAAVQERTAELLPELTRKSVAAAAELFELVRTIRAVAFARDSSANLPKAYIEVALPHPVASEDDYRALGARLGSSRAQAALVFEEK